MDIEIISKVENEYNQFKKDVLMLSSLQVWSCSVMISFYKDVVNYFRYNTISPHTILGIKVDKYIIHSLWSLYLKSDIYNGSRAEEITYLLKELAMKNLV